MQSAALSFPSCANSIAPSSNLIIAQRFGICNVLQKKRIAWGLTDFIRIPEKGKNVMPEPKKAVNHEKIVDSQPFSVLFTFLN